MIRDEALRLFAENDPEAVSVRQIAAAAGVSPGLVAHHFGSKEGLRQAVDDHVLGVFDAMLGELLGDGAAELMDAGAGAGSLSEALLRHLPPGSPLPGYLRRLFLTDAESGRMLFRRLFAMSESALSAMTAAGMAVPGRDPAARAAFLLVNDLALLLLRDRVADVLGDDPMSPEGMARWAPEVLSIYAGGLGFSPGEGSGVGSAQGPGTGPEGGTE